MVPFLSPQIIIHPLAYVMLFPVVFVSCKNETFIPAVSVFVHLHGKNFRSVYFRPKLQRYV